MTTLREVTKDAILDVALETADRFPDLKDHELFDLVSDCIGRELTDIEWRMVRVAYETDEDTAKACVWYSWLA